MSGTATPTPKSNNSSPGPRDSKGWDGKLRVVKSSEQNTPEGPSPPASEDEDEDEDEDDVGNPNKSTTTTTNSGTAGDSHPASTATANAAGFPVTDVPGAQISADEDLLDGVEETETDIDLNHSRIASLPALRLERFKHLTRLCLRQNSISHVVLPEDWDSAATLQELDLYDNAIAHIKGLETLTELTSLDLSFNGIKHIKRLEGLKKLKELYFVQNKIAGISGLEALVELENLELGGNRIREIEGLDALTKLRELWLGKNKIVELKNLHSLQNLTLLSIQSNRLTSASLSHLSTLPNLTDLYLSHNAITDLQPLSTSTHLHILDISSNPVKSLSGLAPLTELEELWASNCQIEDFEEVRTELGAMKDLNTVYFEGNPLEKKQRALYRNKVKLALPNIRQIDATYVRID